MCPKEKLQDTITVTVGFLDRDVEKNLETYKENFDIVLTDNESFNKVLDIITIKN